MAGKKSELQKVLDAIDADIAMLQRSRALIVAQMKQAPVRRPRAVPKDEKAS